MTNTNVEPVVRTSVRVAAPVEHAFRVFTEGFDRWWPRSHHIAPTDIVQAVLEPKIDGRWFERDAAGQECEWGRVLAWDPPRHVAMSWHLNVAFQYDPDPTHASRIDVQFAAAGDDATVVELIHSQLDRHGPDWQHLATSIGSPEGGWPTLLQLFADSVSAGR